RAVLALIDGDAAAGLVTHAARGLAATKPPGAAKALLDYLPYAEDNASYQEIQAALHAVAVRDGKIDPALFEALKDPNAVRRGTAAQAVSTAGGPEVYAAIRPLLKDPKPSVRLGVALALVGAYDAEAVPVLIELLAELPPALRPPAEDYLNVLAGEWAVAGPKGHDAMSGKLRRAVWASWWKSTDGSLLLEEFRSRTPADEDREKIDALIGSLGDDAKRAVAQEGLLGFGKKASAQLRRAAADPKVGAAAQRCLEAVEKDEPNPLPQAAARLLALRKPEGTIPTLLGYVAVSESDEATAQLIDILAAVGCAGGKADDAVLKALTDPSAARRSAAAQAICKARATSALPAVRRLLADKDPVVRLRAAAGLASAGDKAAVPALISALADLPVEQLWEAEDVLCRLAGDAAPASSAGADKESRAKAVAAWESWYKESGPGLDLAKADLSGGAGGQLIVVEQWNRLKGNRGRVLEMDAAGKVRWEIDNLDYPWDAQVLRNGNVLVIEQQNRVTERDRKNKVVWDKHFTSPFVCERLPNGHTWLGCRNALTVVNKDGVVVFNHPYTTNTILGAKRFRDGGMAFVSYSGEYVRLDRAGKPVKTFTVPISSFGLTGADILPGDRVLVSASSNNRVMEFGPDGKEVWSAAVVNPTPPTRLANGHTLVASNGQMALYEIDRKGKVVREWKGLTHNPFRAFRR
ncbi:MAG: HEAT repeat domain-containing protein, partial [Gemmataceae bacterium]